MNRPANDDGPRDIGLYVINLDSSSMPMPLTVPFRHELVGFTVFRSRSFEYGRERFRLHLGYFESAGSAEEALSVVRKHYPAAWISAAPESQLGSLDNTLNTEFRLLRTAYARVVTRASPTKAPAPVAAKGAASAVVKEPSLDPANRAAASAVPSPQHYAVQLEWSLAPVIAADVPRLAIFAEYHLYTVRMLRGGSPQQGLRLGFFTSAVAARRVAEYVRPEFPGLGVVPVSHREYSRAIELARQRALKAVARGQAPGASAVARESEGRVVPPRAAAPALPGTPPRARGLVSPVQTPRTREDPPSPLGAPNLESDHWRDW
jgi:hypothetical protein